jgi:hypothetical protein
MRNRLVHAFLIPMQNTLAVLPLTTKYRIELSSPHGEQVQISVHAANERSFESRTDEERPVDSITVAFGKNGGGKTQLLFNVCNTIAQQRGTRPLGILWEEDGRLLFDPGSHLRRLQFQGDVQIIKRGIFEDQALFGAAFYTTSPFEASRRRLALADSDTLDVTPSFGVDNPFGGVPLLLAARALPDDLEFIQAMEVQPKLKMPSLRSLIEEYTSERRRAGVPSEPKYASLPQDKRGLLRQLPGHLSDFLSNALAIEMHRARLKGKEAAATLLSQLADALPHIDQDPSISDSMNGRIMGFLERRAEGVSVTSYQILLAIQRACDSGQMRLKRKGSFVHYVRDANEWRADDVEGLQMAESLGLLKWSFLKLSSGQVAMLMLFASLAGALGELARKGKRFVVLAVDEGEMFMHPAWQRTFLSQLMKFLAFYRSRFDLIHLVVSTHSLIVAGDAPPNRLFDVVSGRMQNGFAAPPDELLKTVYHVPEFAGQMAEELYDKIGNYLRHGGSDEEAQQVQGLVDQIASTRLRRYLQDEVYRRMELHRAEA